VLGHVIDPQARLYVTNCRGSACRNSLPSSTPDLVILGPFHRGPLKKMRPMRRNPRTFCDV
jgi:hypothetical protein